MANLGFIETLLGIFPDKEKRSLGKAFEEVTKFTRVGVAETGTKSENLSGAFYAVTTSTTAGQEVAVSHNFGTAPYLLVPVVDLTSSGGSIIPMTVTRAADASYLYLSSSETEKTMLFYVEA